VNARLRTIAIDTLQKLADSARSKRARGGCSNCGRRARGRGSTRFDPERYTRSPTCPLSFSLLHDRSKSSSLRTHLASSDCERSILAGRVTFGLPRATAGPTSEAVSPTRGEVLDRLDPSLRSILELPPDGHNDIARRRRSRCTMSLPWRHRSSALGYCHVSEISSWMAVFDA
jgi:hypothetical protein